MGVCETLVKSWICLIISGVSFLSVFCVGNLGLAFICCIVGIIFLLLFCTVIDNGPKEVKKGLAEAEKEYQAKRNARRNRGLWF